MLDVRVTEDSLHACHDSLDSDADAKNPHPPETKRSSCDEVRDESPRGIHDEPNPRRAPLK